MATKITGLPVTRPIVGGDGILTQEARSYFTTLTNRSMIVGNGSPAGIVEAEQGALYLDEDGATGAILYVKSVDSVSGDKAGGWVLV